MGIGYLCISVTRAQRSCRGGGREPPPPGEKSMGDHLKFKNQYHFQYDTAKSLKTKKFQFLRLFTIIKLLILIQSFYFIHILHSSESFVYNRFYIQTCQTSANWWISDFFVWFWVILVNCPDPV